MSEQTIPTQPHSPPESEAPGRRLSPRRVRIVGYSVGVVLAVGLAALALWLASVRGENTAAPATSDPNSGPTPVALQRPLVSEAGLVDRSGVRITQVAVSGGGGLIDLRFMVVDPAKAGAIHDLATPPTIVDDATGVVVNQLLMGHSHTDPFEAGVTYYLVFENPGDLVQRGGTVSVLLGDAEVDHVDVR